MRNEFCPGDLAGAHSMDRGRILVVAQMFGANE
jgi:hypothetical protein